MANSNQPPSATSQDQHFATTNWSVVVAASGADSPHAAVALSALCERYWYPLYAFVRRRGYGSADAQDLTQAFFAMVLEKNSFSVADPDRGRFRSFLLGALSNFLMNYWREGCTQKRGGNRPLLSLNFHHAEERYIAEPSHQLTAERIYDRKWALTLLETAMGKLSEEYTQAGKDVLFDGIKSRLGGDSPSISIRHIAAELQMTEGAVKVAVHRLRRRYRDLLRNEIADTVANPADVDDELRTLFDLLGN